MTKGNTDLIGAFRNKNLECSLRPSGSINERFLLSQKLVVEVQVLCIQNGPSVKKRNGNYNDEIINKQLIACLHESYTYILDLNVSSL